MSRVFVSHASADRVAVEREIVSLLLGYGVDVWYARTDIKTADEWERSILQGLKDCDWFLIVLTPLAAQSEWVKDELHWALSNGRRIVPVLLADCRLEDFHIRLPRIQFVDFRNPSDESKLKLLQTWGLQVTADETDPCGAAVNSGNASRDESMPDAIPTSALSATSKLSPSRLRRLRLALQSHLDDIPGDAMDELVQDRSIPATEVLFQDALIDKTCGFGIGGLVDLGPLAASWLYKLLTHEDGNVVAHACATLSQSANVVTSEMWNHMADTIEEIGRVGDLRVLERRLAEVMGNEGSFDSRPRDWLRQGVEEVQNLISALRAGEDNMR